MEPFKTKIRGMVARDKYTTTSDSGVVLDLSYITDRIIAMATPAEKVEALYRNHTKELANFFNTNHREHYMIYNLNEKSYDFSKFYDRVQLYSFPDHHPPSLQMLFDIVTSMDSFLSADPQNVVAVHCKAGRSRTGTVVASYLIYAGMFSDADEASNYFAHKRSASGEGINVASQLRYVKYFAECIRTHIIPHPKRVKITKIQFRPVPLFGMDRSFAPMIEVICVNTQKTLFSNIRSEPTRHRSTEARAVVMTLNLVVQGDILMRFYHNKASKAGMALKFRCQLNTGFMHAPSLKLTRSELDAPQMGFVKDKNFRPEFCVIFQIEELEVPGRPSVRRSVPAIGTDEHNRHYIPAAMPPLPPRPAESPTHSPPSPLLPPFSSSSSSSPTVAPGSPKTRISSSSSLAAYHFPASSRQGNLVAVRTSSEDVTLPSNLRGSGGGVNDMSASLAALDLQKPSPLISQAPSYYPSPSLTTFVPTSYSAPQVNLTPQPPSLHGPGVALPYPNQFHPTSYNNMVSASILQQALPSFISSSPIPTASSIPTSTSTTPTSVTSKPLPKPPTLSPSSSSSSSPTPSPSPSSPSSANAQTFWQQSSSSSASSSLLSPHPRPILQSSDPLRGTFQHPSPLQPQQSSIVRSNGEVEARRAINTHTNGTSPTSFFPNDGVSLHSLPLAAAPQAFVSPSAASRPLLQQQTQSLAPAHQPLPSSSPSTSLSPSFYPPPHPQPPSSSSSSAISSSSMPLFPSTPASSLASPPVANEGAPHDDLARRIHML